MSVTVTGLPDGVAVSTQLQLQASAVLSDGSRRDVTESASWRSSNGAVAAVSATGLLTALAIGDADITATFQSITATARAVVAGFRIRGVVHETAPTLNVAVAGARLEIGGGSLNGLVVMTDGQGAFELPMVASAGFRIQVKKPGYEDVEFGIVELPRDVRPDIAMSPTQGPAPVARLQVRLDEIGSTVAMLGFTPIHVDGTTSTAHEPATYLLDFGDGTSARAATATHACERDGMLTLRLTVTDRFGRASTATHRLLCTTFERMGGYGWDHFWTNPQTGDREHRRFFFRQQSGATLSGTFSFFNQTNHFSRSFTGTLSGQRTITLTLDDGTVYSGEILLKDQYGDGFLSYDRTIALRTTAASLSGTLAVFRFYDPF